MKIMLVLTIKILEKQTPSMCHATLQCPSNNLTWTSVRNVENNVATQGIISRACALDQLLVFNILLPLYIYQLIVSVCVCVCVTLAYMFVTSCHEAYVELRGQLSQECFLFPPHGSQDSTSGYKTGDKHLQAKLLCVTVYTEYLHPHT